MNYYRIPENSRLVNDVSRNEVEYIAILAIVVDAVIERG